MESNAKNKTLIIGASTNPERYAYKAAEQLLAHKHDIYLLGNRPGELFGREIINSQQMYPDVDTVSLYLSGKNQVSYYDYILSLQPRRVIFNPGTENPELQSMLQKASIDAQEACTLVLLATGQF
ncbi:MAG: CoA-binding protein [Bacteroidales bacterium]|nr:CoA-binding protein [Bacteroidales bacterium]MDD4641729.1 CoA-binding protein [Bacteroidales bacterium]